MSYRTPDEVEAELAIRRIPGGARSWLDVAMTAATEAGALLPDVCRPGRTTPKATRARRMAWAELRTEQYSLNEIAAPWGMNHTVVADGIRLYAEEK
jgi:hypothetical protein